MGTETVCLQQKPRLEQDNNGDNNNQFRKDLTRDPREQEQQLSQDFSDRNHMISFIELLDDQRDSKSRESSNHCDQTTGLKYSEDDKDNKECNRKPLTSKATTTITSREEEKEQQVTHCPFILNNNNHLYQNKNWTNSLCVKSMVTSGLQMVSPPPPPPASTQHQQLPQVASSSSASGSASGSSVSSGSLPHSLPHPVSSSTPIDSMSLIHPPASSSSSTPNNPTLIKESNLSHASPVSTSGSSSSFILVDSSCHPSHLSLINEQQQINSNNNSSNNSIHDQNQVIHSSFAGLHHQQSNQTIQPQHLSLNNNTHLNHHPTLFHPQSSANFESNSSSSIGSNSSPPVHTSSNPYLNHPASSFSSPVAVSQQSSQSINSSPSSSSNNNSMYTTADYLAQLLKDQKQVAAFPGVFFHLERLLNEEINRVRSSLFQISGSEKKPLKLPEPEGPVICKSDKIYVPIDKHPEYNFVGRILGPRGMTAKQLEHETGCKIMVRGKGSMRDRKKEEQNRGKPNWEHLNEPLHVLITCEDTLERADIKLMRAREEVEKLLVPVADGEDDLKKRQLMELAIINGTYRESGSKTGLEGVGGEPLKLMANPSTLLRHPLGAPLIISPSHLISPAHQVMMNGSTGGSASTGGIPVSSGSHVSGSGPHLTSHHHHHPGSMSGLMSAHDAAAAAAAAGALIYSRAFDYSQVAAGYGLGHNLLTGGHPHLLEFHPGQLHHPSVHHPGSNSADAAAAAAAQLSQQISASASSLGKIRGRTVLSTTNMLRDHPYQRTPATQLEH